MLMMRIAGVVSALLACSWRCCSASSCNDESCPTRPESLDLLQRSSSALFRFRSRATSGQELVITGSSDPGCGDPTGSITKIYLQDGVCVDGFNFSCSCDGDSKVAIITEYDSMDCQSKVKEHAVPLSACVSGSVTNSSDAYQTVDDGGSCPCCGSACGASNYGDDVRSLEVEDILPPEKKNLLSQDVGTQDPPRIRRRLYHNLKCKGKPYLDSWRATRLTPPAKGEWVEHYWMCTCRKGRKMVKSKSVWGPAKFYPQGCSPATRMTSQLLDLQECPESATCTVTGDPHITVFDQAKVSLLSVGKKLAMSERADSEGAEDVYDWGDYWLVKSEEVSIQARYRKVYYPKASQPLNNTYLTAVAVGGPFLDGHTFIVEPQSGSVVWRLADGGHKILFDTQGAGDIEQEQFFKQGDLIEAKYSNRTAILPKADSSLVHGLDIKLPSDVMLMVDRFGKHLDLQVEMPRCAAGEGGMDGQCGNFNGDASDDTAEQLEQRMGYQVPPEERLFIS